MPRPANSANEREGATRRNHRPTPKSERTRARILDSAAQVFAEHGYADVSLRDIADAAGTKAGSLYYYFTSKDELVEEVLRAAIDKIDEHVRELVDALGPDASPSERIRAAVQGHTESVLERTDYAKALMRIAGQIPEPSRTRYNRHSRAYGEYWGKLFEDARDAGEVRVDVDLVLVRLLVIGSLNWTIEWPASFWSPEAITTTVLKMVFEGLGSGPRQA